MAHLNIEKVSLASRDRDKEEQKKTLRKKIIFVLINHYLEENGFVQSADVLKSESKFSVNDYAVCDNIHLESILQDFESYHFLRYQKLPQIVKKIPENQRQHSICEKSKNMRVKSASSHIISTRKWNLGSSERICKVSSLSCDQNGTKLDGYVSAECDARLFIPVGLFESRGAEWQDLANMVLQDFVVSNKSVRWSDIIGHERAKQVLKEAVVYPIKYRELFASAVVPWKSILLYGPTGTGKTSIAAAVAWESKAAFFNVCVSTVTSKWRGESEKLVKILFELAKHYAPSVIFIDEIDSLLSHRGSDHEASRRMKTEFFSQMDATFSCDKNVFVLAATNMPWELDHAILRRMEKRLLIPLPDTESRALLFKKYLPSSIQILENVTLKAELNYEELASASGNYSASDIELVCKEAKMNLIRQIFRNLENNCHDKTFPKCINIETLTMSDVLLVLGSTRPSNTVLSEKFTDWKENHGSE